VTVSRIVVVGRAIDGSAESGASYTSSSPFAMPTRVESGGRAVGSIPAKVVGVLASVVDVVGARVVVDGGSEVVLASVATLQEAVTITRARRGTTVRIAT
jgi:hypothetical protein